MHISRRKILAGASVGALLLATELVSGQRSVLAQPENSLKADTTPVSKDSEHAMKGYWIIFGAEVTDAEAQKEYGRLWAPIAQKYGAVLKPLGANALVEAQETRRVLAVEFDSYAQAKACYEDPAYVAAMKYAHQASHRELIIVEGNLA